MENIKKSVLKGLCFEAEHNYTAKRFAARFYNNKYDIIIKNIVLTSFGRHPFWMPIIFKACVILRIPHLYPPLTRRVQINKRRHVTNELRERIAKVNKYA